MPQVHMSLSTIFSPILDFFYSLRIKKIARMLTTKNAVVLDYGSGSGKLVDKLNEAGIKAIGFEPSAGARKIAVKRNIPIYGKVRRVPGGFDLIMFWHSLEHTENPAQVLKNIRPLLKKNGKVLIAVPNIDSFEAKIAGEKWFHFSYPLHLIHFTPRAIETMLTRNGFVVGNIDYFNPEYTVAGLVQTFLNLFLPKDVLYSVVAHRRSE